LRETTNLTLICSAVCGLTLHEQSRPDNSLDPVDLGRRDARDIAIRDLEHLPVDDAIAHRPAQQAVVRVDLGEPVGEPR